MVEKQKRNRHRAAFLLVVSTLMITMIAVSQNEVRAVDSTAPPVQEEVRQAQDSEMLHAIITQLQSEAEALRVKNAALNKQVEDIQNPHEVLSFEPTYYDIPLSEELQDYTQAICSSYEVEYELALAIMWKESTFNADSISSSGDYGLMQVNKCNFDWIAKALAFPDDTGDTFINPYYNIQAGVYMISLMLSKYETERCALMAYNYGEGAARGCWSAGIYTSPYAESVLSRKTLIQQNKYI